MIDDDCGYDGYDDHIEELERLQKIRGDSDHECMYCSHKCMRCQGLSNRDFM